jgi:serine/threonine protein kinase
MPENSKQSQNSPTLRLVKLLKGKILMLILLKYVHCFVQSFGWYDTEDALFITMEYFEHGDLQNYLFHSPPLSEAPAAEVIYQILEGVSYLHENLFSHRDLKPSVYLLPTGQIYLLTLSPEYYDRIFTAEALVGKDWRFWRQQKT